ETAIPKAGERKFGDQAKIDYDEAILRWMDHYLKGIDNGVDREKPVRYFVMGRDQWREADTWPPQAKLTALFLTPQATSGKIKLLANESPSGQSQPVAFVSDPANPVTNSYDSSGAHDYAKLAERSDVLTFDSKILDQDTEVSGPILARIYISCD